MAKKVLIVDDSALVRKQLSEIISTLDFEIDIAKNGQEAVSKALNIQYDVITMDINMPIMDGIEAVRQIMKKKPTAILMISSLTTADADVTMDALDLGAIDYIPKPGTMNVGKNENRQEILQKVRSLSLIPKRRLKSRRTNRVQREKPEKQKSQKPQAREGNEKIEKIILIGSSTGGPGLIEQICASLPLNYKYPVCIVQHMPEQFTQSFASRLDRASKLNVYETSKNMEVLPGNIYIAKGGTHLNFTKKISGKVIIRQNDEKGDAYFQPSVNEMMLSAAKVFNPSDVVAVLLTGIGDDGAIGMVELKKAGAYTLGESEESATVYGMPKVAFDMGGISEQLDFMKILKKVTTLK